MAESGALRNDKDELEIDKQHEYSVVGAVGFRDSKVRALIDSGATHNFASSHRNGLTWLNSR